MPAVLLLALILLVGCTSHNHASPYQPLVILKNDVATLTIKTDAGGRAISYQLNGKPNIFQSQPNTWFEPAPEASAFSPWKTYDGGIVWIGPQQDFWTRQDQNTKKRDKKSVWPPDPFQIYGDFKVVRSTATEVELLGPKSEVTGMQLKKHYRLNPDGSVSFSVTGTCTWVNPSAVDLWTLYRFDPNWPAYGIITKSEKPKFNHNEKVTPTNGVINWQRTDDFVYCLAKEPGLSLPTRKKARGKAQFFSAVGLQAAIGPKMAFVLRCTPTPTKDVHPAQGSSEIYRSITPQGTGILELENHSAYKTLQPGESIHFSETWQILPYDGEHTPEAHQQFLRSLIK